MTTSGGRFEADISLFYEKLTPAGKPFFEDMFYNETFRKSCVLDVNLSDDPLNFEMFKQEGRWYLSEDPIFTSQTLIRNCEAKR